jgi:transposase InsO family protein
MSRRGNRYDNAVMESWFSTFKFELGESFESIRRCKDLAFDYIEGFYNQHRRHSSLGYATPAAFEDHYHATQLAPAAWRGPCITKLQHTARRA